MRLLIKRFDGNRHYFDEFEFDFKENETILELLDRANYKKRFAYRSFCRSAICGTCAVKVNDRTVLACKSKVKDLIQNDEVIVEPVDRSVVLRDLVVDHSYIEKSIKDNKLWFVDEIDETKENLQTPEELKKYDKQTDCILCMACHFECEALDYDKDFAGPFVFSKYFRFVFDSRDKSDKQERIELAKENGLYNCINCQKCVYVCPKHIASAFDIKMLQQNDKNPPIQDFGFENNFF
ncbi:succinate dehydrogenase/fumarate reductase iron-sulfur subunit [Caminibacter mediatlanticus TB-2]|uniref:Fumarate reductase iron-sulfur subunit n=1 Tax=Caminibacter mediatlanticus TB-2 TaxID=391592 RepID=A0ABX5VBQ2_9BACT|nr:2Fe-2S iron-sulfur cluster-binding protein [Caminibacter mediatlanticus]QCT94992.1 succinate dehydrogenase/fumarate reductase iron-sulfur subunit [Caminibacter mediatlanticus TB-2]